MKAAVVSGIVAGFTAAAVLLAVWLAVSLAAGSPARVDQEHGVVIEGGSNGPTTTFTVSQLPTP